MDIAPEKTTRKQITVLFCDIVDYTSRSSEIDIEDLSEEIRCIQTLCAQVIQQYHGHISNYLGDGIMALFGHPKSNEFDVTNAAHAALKIIKQIESNNQSTEWHNKQPVAVRIGIATSVAVVGDRAGEKRDQDELIFGEAPNLAARLQALAKPNTAIISLRTRRLIGSVFEFEDLGEFNLKGFKQAVSAWQIIRKSTVKKQSPYLLQRTATPFLSRLQELSFLMHCYQRTIQNNPIFIHITGEAGIGKSRLVHHFLDNLSQQKILKVNINCSPYYEASAFHPLIEGCIEWASIDQQDSDNDKLEKIKKILIRRKLLSNENLVLFCELLSVNYPSDLHDRPISAEEKYLKTMELLVKVLISLSEEKPLLMIAEDLHWADPSTIGFFDYALKQLTGQKIFIIQTSRHEFNIPWKQSDFFIKLPLRGLSEKDSFEIIKTVFSNVDLPEKTKKELVEKSAGVPLYLEECSLDILNQVYDKGITNKEGKFNVPDSLQDSLNARLDSLGQAKDLTQLASIFFEDFTYLKIKKLAELNDIEVDKNIDVLIQSQMLKLIPHEDEDVYTFKHALFREAAYHSLLKKNRKKYHKQVAELFMLDDKNLIHRQPELLALHYERSTEPNKAIGFWLKSGRLAIMRAEINDAKNHIKNGIKALEKLDDKIEIKQHEMELRFTLAVCRTLGSGYFGDNVTSDFKRSMELSDELEIAENQWAARYGYWRCLVCQAEFKEAMKISVALSRLSESFQDRKLIMTAIGIKGFARMIDGKFNKADGYFKSSITYYNEDEDRNIGIYFGQDPYVTIQGLMAVNSLISDNVDQSKREIQTAINVARNINHPYTIAETLRVAAVHAQIAGDQTTLLVLSQEAIEISRKFQFEGLLAASKIFFAYHQVRNYQDASFISSIEDNLERYKDKYALLFYPYFQGLLAQAYLNTEQYQEAFTMANHAYMQCQACGEQWVMVPIMQTKILSALHGKLTDKNEIIQWHKHSLELAKVQHADLYFTRLESLIPLFKQQNLY